MTFGTSSVTAIHLMCRAIYARVILSRPLEFDALMDQGFGNLLKNIMRSAAIPIPPFVFGLGLQVWFTNPPVAYTLSVISAGLYMWSFAVILS